MAGCWPVAQARVRTLPVRRPGSRWNAGGRVDGGTGFVRTRPSPRRAGWDACAIAWRQPVVEDRASGSFRGLFFSGLLGHREGALFARRDVRHLVVLASPADALAGIAIHALERLPATGGRPLLSADLSGVRPEPCSVPRCLAAAAVGRRLPDVPLRSRSWLRGHACRHGGAHRLLSRWTGQPVLQQCLRVRRALWHLLLRRAGLLCAHTLLRTFVKLGPDGRVPGALPVRVELEGTRRRLVTAPATWKR